MRLSLPKLWKTGSLLYPFVKGTTSSPSACLRWTTRWRARSASSPAGARRTTRSARPAPICSTRWVRVRASIFRNKQIEVVKFPRKSRGETLRRRAGNKSVQPNECGLMSVGTCEFLTSICLTNQPLHCPQRKEGGFSEFRSPIMLRPSYVCSLPLGSNLYRFPEAKFRCYRT